MKMKILIVSDAWHPQINGVVRTYEYLSKELTKMGHDVKIIGPHDFPWRIALPSYPEIKLAILPNFRMNKIIANYMPDQIHIATEGPLGRAARFYCMRHKRKFTTAYHTHFPAYAAKRIEKYVPFLYNVTYKACWYIMRQFHKPSNCVMIATQSVQDELRSWNFESPMAKVVRGTNLGRFSPLQNVKDPHTDGFKHLKRPIALSLSLIHISEPTRPY